MKQKRTKPIKQLKRTVTKKVKQLKLKSKPVKRRKMPDKELGEKLVNRVAELEVFRQLLDVVDKNNIFLVREELPFIFVAKEVELSVHRKNKYNATSFQPTEGPKKESFCVLAILYVGRRDEMIQAVFEAEDDFLNGLIDTAGCKVYCIQSVQEIEGVLRSIGKSPNEWED